MIRTGATPDQQASNNITYAVFGDVMNDWGCYPTGDPNPDCIPAWGFADALQPRCTGAPRYYHSSKSRERSST
jgi:hypothetical protein